MFFGIKTNGHYVGGPKTTLRTSSTPSKVKEQRLSTPAFCHHFSTVQTIGSTMDWLQPKSFSNQITLNSKIRLGPVCLH